MILNFILGLIIGYVFIIIYEQAYKILKNKIKRDPIVRFKNHHLHHSIYGLILIIIWILYPNFIILGAGIGIIIRHSFKERKIVFISKK